MNQAQKDHELLLMAAKAVKLDYYIETSGGSAEIISGGSEWNPILNDCQLLRLARQLKISIDYEQSYALCRSRNGSLIQEFWGSRFGVADRKDEARAILAVAAKIWEAAP